MEQDFLHTILGNTGLRAHRLGLSATYRPGKKTIYKAIDEGLNYFFGLGIDTQLTDALRDVLKKDRERFVVSTGAYNFIWGHQNLRPTLENAGREEPVCPDEPQKSLPDLGKSLKAPPLHLYPENPPTLAEKALKQTQDLGLKFP